ncbi:MAG: 23S rRNA (pseudouridine(1915)-N(3))-methyltransferase RlmH [Clostridiaceae bacterium]|nr:23S rRNA (pseudouridine(1915)-N(3))-methyltransferase RlmH [Clostridiaceae bacterium]
MKLTIISPGKIKEPWLQAGIDEYIKRLSRYCQVQCQQVDDTPDSWTPARAKEEEGRRLLARIKPQAWVVVLDLQGRQPDSLELARLLPQWLQNGGSEVVFVIGGPHGLDQPVLDRAQATLALSRLTFTHQMARLLLLEQCYRAFRIVSGEPYHK